MLDSHSKQIRDKVGESLSAAGIGLKYHAMNLANFGPVATPLLAWCKDDLRGDLDTGRGWTVTGPGHSAYTLSMLLARATHLCGRKTRILPLVRLVEWLKADHDLLPELVDCHVLFILQFHQSYTPQTLPLTGWQIQSVEALVNERLDNNLAVFTHGAVVAPSAQWWSESLMNRLSTVNRTVHVP